MALSNNEIVSVYPDTSGNLWIATDEGGLNKFNIERESFTRYLHDPFNSNSICTNKTYSIIENEFRGKQALWIATIDGLEIFNPETEHFRHIKYNPKKSSKPINA